MSSAAATRVVKIAMRRIFDRDRDAFTGPEVCLIQAMGSGQYARRWHLRQKSPR